jgi:hypothetical protein
MTEWEYFYAALKALFPRGAGSKMDVEKPFSKLIGFGKYVCQDVLFCVVSERDFC